MSANTTAAPDAPEAPAAAPAAALEHIEVRVGSLPGRIETIALNGGRKVSDGFKSELIKQYLATHTVFSRMYAHEKKVFDDNNENTLQKEIVDFLDFIFKEMHLRIGAAGLEHKLVNKENHEYSLDKK